MQPEHLGPQRRRNPGRGKYTGKLAQGCARGGLQYEIGFKIDDETLTEMRALAIAEGTSLSEQVRRLIEIGLETLKEEGRRSA